MVHGIISSIDSTRRGFEEVLAKHNKSVIKSYDLAETETELFITERVNNILFVKK